jgi:hypothetical protein
MSTPITEGHWNLVEKLCDLLDTEEMIGPSPAQKAAQLIADSEARAIATQLEVVVILTRRWLNVEKERDQLRARAEKAEAELATERARLDWLAVSDTWFDYPATESFNPETFRAAIDAAMKEGAK